jgi:hypothetical protein
VQARGVNARQYLDVNARWIEARSSDIRPPSVFEIEYRTTKNTMSKVMRSA